MSYRFLELTKGKIAVVDEDDFESVSKYKWSATCNPDGRRPNSEPKWYAVRSTPTGREYLHRRISKARKGLVVNHKCGNGLDCRKSNLENITQGENIKHRATSCDCFDLFDFDSGIGF